MKQIHPFESEGKDLFYSFQSLYYISRLLSLSPYRNDNGNFAQLLLSDIVYGFFIMLLIAAIIGQGLVVRMIYTYANMFLSIIILDLSSCFSQVFLVLMSIWFTIMRHNEQISFFLKSLAKIDRILNNTLSKTNESMGRKLYIKCMGTTFMTIVLAIVDGFLWVRSQRPIYEAISFGLVKYWMFYYLFMIFFQILAKIDVLRQRFELVNKFLNSMNDENVLIHEIVKTLPVKKLDVHLVFEIHDLLCDLVNVVNSTHGHQILILTCVIIVMILNLLNVGIIIILMAVSAGGSSLEFMYASVGIQAVFCLSFVIMCILLAAGCTATVAEADETRVIARKLFLKGPKSSEIFKELVLFVNTSRSPFFSAAGFFTVNYSLLLAILGAVTSYFIVLLQFANV